ncbi:MAG: endonuclease [Chitinophagaceae bacterium]|nr:MAG: endonuclease [Chitinophagaceae bacterium]
MTSFDLAYEAVGILVRRFEKGIKHYTSPQYQESEARQDFIDDFFTALGWDVRHREQQNPYEQEVKIEKSQRQQESKAQKRADYAFYMAPNFKDERFFAEAKKPSVGLRHPDHYFQTIRYGYNANVPLSVLTDFEEFHIIDCRIKPDIRYVFNGQHKEYRYTDYLDKEKFAEIYWLFSREAVANSSLETYASALPKPKGKAVQKALFKGGYKPIDEDFLEYIDGIREDLAKAFKRNDEALNGEELTEAVQRTIDRLVFIRFLEDKLIEPENHVSEWTSWKDFVGDCRKLDAKYNGVVFKKHFIDDQKFSGAEEITFKRICSDISNLNSPYQFNYLPIHILGSIYERFLGKVVVSTAKRVTIEVKPEVRKAGGVYYTPKYIVDYIVGNTVGKQIEGKAPKEISEMRFADIACGSGSFLIGVYDLLLEYHKKYYNDKLSDKKEIDKRSEDFGNAEYLDGQWILTLKLKQNILLKNIYGVDIDAQAVEVTQLSLFLKMLEDETLSTTQTRQGAIFSKVLPDLTKNIVCGNSLVGTDILNEKLFSFEEEKGLNPMDYESAFPEVIGKGGFDSIVGNPPWGAEFDSYSKKYLLTLFPWINTKVKDSYSFFVSKALKLLSTGGQLGYITPNTWLLINTAVDFRREILKKDIKEIIDYGDGVFKDATVESCTVILRNRKIEKNVIQVKRIKKNILVFENGVDVRLWEKDELCRIILELNPAIQKLKEKCYLNTNSFAVDSEIIWGIKPYQVGYGEPPQTKKILEERSYHSEHKIGKEWKPLLVGSNVNRYELDTTKIQYIKYGKWLMYPSNESKMLGRKILLRQTSDKIRAIIDDKQYYCQNSVFIITTKLDYHYILGLLNSKLFNFLYKLLNPQQGKVFAEIKPSVIKSLPVKTSPKKQLVEKVSDLVKQLVEAKSLLQVAKTSRDSDYLQNKCIALDRQIDVLVYQLYELTPNDIAIIEKV